MKTPSHLLALTKNEQRVVIIIMIALLAGAAARFYRQGQAHLSQPATSPVPAARSLPSTDEDQASSDEAR